MGRGNQTNPKFNVELDVHGKKINRTFPSRQAIATEYEIPLRQIGYKICGKRNIRDPFLKDMVITKI